MAWILIELKNKNISHRDIKADNIMVELENKDEEENSIIKNLILIDFGCSKDN